MQEHYPFWAASGGRDHIFLSLHDEGPCFAPREMRPAMLLTHYGYYAQHPRPWGTYYDDNFMQDPRFYDRHLGDSKHPTPCFARGKDLVIPPWKEPRFWRKALADPALRGPAAIRRRRAGLVLTLTLTLTLLLLLLLTLRLPLTLTLLLLLILTLILTLRLPLTLTAAAQASSSSRATSATTGWPATRTTCASAPSPSSATRTRSSSAGATARPSQGASAARTCR